MSETSSTNLPGPCVEIPRRTAWVRDPAGGAPVPFETHVATDLDLDGLGSPVVLVPPEKLLVNQAGMFWELYIERGKHGHFVGILQGLGEPLSLTERHHGLCDFVVAEPVSAEEAGGELGGVEETVYRFDGSEYRAAESEWR